MDELINELSELQINDDDAKQKIIDLFSKNIKGKKYKQDKLVCGDEGFWIEKKLGILQNSNNAPDLYGYEIKKKSPKTTFGD